MLVYLIFALIVCFGYLFSTLILKNLPFLERLGLSYLVGIGLITQVVFLASWGGYKVTFNNVLFILIVLLSVFLFLNILLKRNLKVKFPNIINEIKSFKLYEKCLALVLFTVVLLSFVITFYYPIHVWDALALYDFVAKVITRTGYFVQVAKQFSYFGQYPLLVPLTHTFVYLAGGNNPQFAYSLYYASFALIFFSLFRKGSSLFIALVATLLVILNPRLFVHSTIAYTNLPYIAYYVVGIIYLYNAIIKNNNSYFFMSAVLIGLSTWARALEPLWITEIIAVFIFSIYKKNLYPFLIYIPTFFVLRQPWNILQIQLFGNFYSTSAQFSSIGSIFTTGIDFKRIIEISIYIYNNMVLTWGPLLILFLVAMFFDIKHRINKENLIMLLLVAGNFLALFAGTYFFSIKFTEWRDIADSAIRISMFFPPLMVYCIYLFTKRVISKN